MDNQDDRGKEIIDENKFKNKDNNKWELFRSVALGILIIANIFLMFKLANIDGTIEALRQEITNLNYTVDSSIGNISSSVEAALKAEASIINNSNYNFGEIKGKNIVLNVEVSPKEYSPQNTYLFSYTLDGKENRTIEAEIIDEQFIVKAIEVPIKSNISLNLLIEKDGVKQIEHLVDISKYEDQLLAGFRKENLEMSYGSGADESEIILDAQYIVQKQVYDYEAVGYDTPIKSATLFIEIDDKVIDSFPMKESYDDLSFDFDGYSHKLEAYKLKLDKGQKAEIYSVIDLDASYKVRINLDEIYGFSDNEPIRDPNFYMEDMYIIFED